MIDKLIHQHKNKDRSMFTDLKDKPSYISAEYGVALSHTLRNEVRKQNVTVAYKTSNKLGNFLKNKKQAGNDMEKTGVYKLLCNDCPSYYVGQTSRSFQTRFKEHLP